MNDKPRAIVLLSGGLDSCVAATWAKTVFGADNCIPVNFAYGQRHARELVASENISDALFARIPVTFNLSQAFHLIGGSSLTSGRDTGNPSTQNVLRTPSDLPPTFVPGRNILMLTVAAAFGYTERAYTLVGGWNHLDYSGYPDCRPQFLHMMQSTLSEGLATPMTIATPLVEKSKVEIIQMGIAHDAPLALSWSCYAGGSIPCGECDSCKIRIEGFAKLGIEDPAFIDSWYKKQIDGMSNGTISNE